MRTAQSITQRDIAHHVGVHYTAIAQFETGRATLSLTTLIRIAPFINLNPAFIETGKGPPFKPQKQGDIIKLLLSTRPGGGVDLFLLQLILTNTKKAKILILLPPLEKAKRKLGVPGSYYAVAMEDDEGTVYLMRAKDAERPTGSIKELDVEVDTVASKGLKSFHRQTVRVTNEMFDKLRGWTIRRPEELSSLFSGTALTESRERFLRLIDALFTDEQERDAVKKAATVMDQEKVELILTRLRSQLKARFSPKIINEGDKSDIS